MEVSKEDFAAWRNNPVTISVFIELEKVVDRIKEVLSASAGRDPGNDRELVGFIKGIKTITEVEYEGNADHVSDSSETED